MIHLLNWCKANLVSLWLIWNSIFSLFVSHKRIVFLKQFLLYLLVVWKIIFVKYIYCQRNKIQKFGLVQTQIIQISLVKVAFLQLEQIKLHLRLFLFLGNLYKYFKLAELSQQAFNIGEKIKKREWKQQQPV